MPIKVAIKTTLSNESAAFPPALHSPRPAQTPPSGQQHLPAPGFRAPFPPSPPALPEPQTGAALPVSGSKTSREQFGARKSEPFASLPPPVQPGVSQGREPWRNLNRFGGEMRGHVWGGRNVPKSYGAFVVEVQPSNLGPCCDLRASLGRGTPHWVG